MAETPVIGQNIAGAVCWCADVWHRVRAAKETQAEVLTAGEEASSSTAGGS